MVKVFVNDDKVITVEEGVSWSVDSEGFLWVADSLTKIVAVFRYWIGATK